MYLELLCSFPLGELACWNTSLAFAYDTETTFICTLNNQEENVIAYTNP